MFVLTNFNLFLSFFLFIISEYSYGCCCSVTKSCPTLCDSMDCSTPGFPVHLYLPAFSQTHVIESVMLSYHLILCCPLSFCPQSFPASGSSNELAIHIRCPKYLSFSISPSNEYSGLISIRIDWFDLLAVQGNLNSLHQHLSLKASVLWPSALLIVQLSHPYMTTGKIIPLTKWIFVGKVMSLLFNMLFKLLLVFLPRSKQLLISWLQSTSAVILKPKKITSAAVSTFPPSICHEVMGLDAMIFGF